MLYTDSRSEGEGTIGLYEPKSTYGIHYGGIGELMPHLSITQEIIPQ